MHWIILSVLCKHNIPAFLVMSKHNGLPVSFLAYSQRKLQYTAVQTSGLISMSRFLWVTVFDLNINFYTCMSSVLVLHCSYNLSTCSQLSRCQSHFLFSRRPWRQVCKLSCFICSLISKLKYLSSQTFHSKYLYQFLWHEMHILNTNELHYWNNVLKCES